MSKIKRNKIKYFLSLLALFILGCNEHPKETLYLSPRTANASHDLIAIGDKGVAIADSDTPMPWLRFDNLDLPQHGSLSIKFARTFSDQQKAEPMTLEVRSGTRDGQLVGFFDLHNTGSWNDYQSRSIRLKPLKNTSSLHFSLHGYGGVNLESFVVEDVKDKAPESPTAEPALGSCINLGGSLEAPRTTAPYYWGLNIESSDLAVIAEAGFDSIRLPVRWSDYALNDAPYSMDPIIFEKVDAIIDWAFKYKLKVVLDVHHYQALNRFPELHSERLLALWSQIADHYKKAPKDQLIFEILNEPFNDSNDGTGLSIARTNDINQRALDVIRQSNPERWVVLATGAFGGVDGFRAVTPPKDSRVILSLHYYSPFKFTHQGAEYIDPPPPFGVSWGNAEERSQIDKDFEIVNYWQKQWGYPVFLGEFGVIRNANTDGHDEDMFVESSMRADWIRYVRESAEDRGYAWCVWDYATTFGAYEKTSAAWEKPILDALLEGHDNPTNTHEIKR